MFVILLFCFCLLNEERQIFPIAFLSDHFTLLRNLQEETIIVHQASLFGFCKLIFKKQKTPRISFSNFSRSKRSSVELATQEQLFA